VCPLSLTHSLSLPPSLHSLPSFPLLSPSSPFPFQRLQLPQPISLKTHSPAHARVSSGLAIIYRAFQGGCWLGLHRVDVFIRQHAHMHASTHIHTYILSPRAIKLGRGGEGKEDATGTLQLGCCLPRASCIQFQTSPCARLAMVYMYVYVYTAVSSMNQFRDHLSLSQNRRGTCFRNCTRHNTHTHTHTHTNTPWCIYIYMVTTWSFHGAQMYAYIACPLRASLEIHKRTIK